MLRFLHRTRVARFARAARVFRGPERASFRRRGSPDLAPLRVPARLLSGSSAGEELKRCDVTGESRREGNRTMLHFKATLQPHPLNIPKTWQNPMQNHIWSPDEIQARLDELPTHKPETFSDKLVHFFVKRVLYEGFNKITGFNKENPTARSCEWRLIILESVAGVPGMVAASMRHFNSLRHLRRDHGWIHTLLEEAENERMHLLVCMKMFKAGFPTRALVLLGQFTMLPLLTLTYMVNPKALHRFVGYLEETASQTYFDLIRLTKEPGTHLNRDWSSLKAPALAVNYWRLNDDAMWLDVLKCLFADETNHRDVNHTFADMDDDDPNPFVEKHLEDAAKAWRMNEDGSGAKTSASNPPL